MRGKIIEQLPSEIDTYVEVFGGAAWVMLAKEKHAPKEVYNDINGNLVNLFRCVKYHPEELLRQLEWVLISREEFVNIRELIKQSGLTDIQRAAMFYILVKNSFSGDMHSFGCGATNIATDKAVEEIKKLHKRFARIIIENKSYENILSSYDKQGTLYYVDPPYYGAEAYYKTGFNTDDHLHLHDILGNIKGKFVLSYNDCEFIRQLYDGYNIIEVQRGHNMKNKQGKSEVYKELIIKNF